MQRRQLWGFRNVGTTAPSNLVRPPVFGSLARPFYKKNYKPTNKARKLWCPAKCSFHMLVVAWFIFWMNCRVIKGSSKDRVTPHTACDTEDRDFETQHLHHTRAKQQSPWRYLHRTQYIAVTEKIICLKDIYNSQCGAHMGTNHCTSFSALPATVLHSSNSLLEVDVQILSSIVEPSMAALSQRKRRGQANSKTNAL